MNQIFTLHPRTKDVATTYSSGVVANDAMKHVVFYRFFSFYTVLFPLQKTVCLVPFEFGVNT